MSDAKSPPELSMDEILATIRRIIAEDEQSSTAAPSAGTVGGPRAAPGSPGGVPAEPPKPAAGAGAGEDVLELTDALNEDGTVRRLAPIGSSSRAADRVREAPPPEVQREAEPETRREPELRLDSHTAPPPGQDQGAANDERLVAEVTSLASAAAFARLASTPRTRRDPPLVGDRPLDEIVRDLLRPLLQTWLDENLPDIVERLVAAEIARISGKAGTA